VADPDGRGFRIASAYVAVSLDEDQVDAGIAALNSKLAGIRDAAINLGLNQAEVDAAIADIKAKLEAIRGQNAGVGISQADLDAAIAEIKAKLAALGADKVEIHIGTTGAPQATAQMAGMAAVMKAIEANSGPLVAAITGLVAAEKSTGDQSEDTAAKVRGAGAAVVAAGQLARMAGGMWGLLTKEVTLFGGALGDLHMVGQIPLWHLLMDGILETGIALTEATIALAVFGAAAAPAAEDIYTHVKSVDEVVKSLGVDIAPVTGHFHDLAQAMAPQVVELYGGALNLMGKSGNSLEMVVSRLVTGFDDWMARLDEFSSKQSHTDGIVQAGADVLQQMSVILDHLGVAFENLMKSDPGTVHFLLDVVEGASKLVEVFTMIPTPILYTALAIHSFLLWGGLLTTWATKAVSPLINVGKSLYSLAAGLGLFGEGAQVAAAEAKAAAEAADKTGKSAQNTGNILTWINKAGVWGWAGIGVAALGGLIYWMTTADSATKAFIANLTNGLASLNAGQAILQIGSDVQSLDRQLTLVGPHIQAVNEQTSHLESVAGKNLEQALDAGPTASGWAHLSESVAAGAKSIVSWFGLIHSSMDKASDIDAYKAAIVSLTGEQTRLFGETGKLMSQGYSYSESLSLMDMAGVKASDSAALMRTKVDNLITGYKDMSVQGGILANSVNAVTFASEQQDSKITELTQSWTGFIGMVTGSESGFATFETQISGLGQAANGMVSSLSISGGKVSTSLKQAATSASSSYTSQAMSASSANSAVTTYTNNLVKGSNATQTATSYQQKLTTSLENGGDSATKASSAVSSYTDAVTKNGVGSSQQAAARAQLIKDLQSTRTVTKAAGAAAQVSTAQIDGLSAADLQLKQTFIQAITDGNSLMNSLLEQASAAGLGAKGTQLLTQAGKDMVAQMLPMAKGSSDATAQLYALAQEAGYHGPDAFSSLVSWVGKTKNAEQQLEQITGKLTIASADLAGDVTNLANAVNANLNQAMSAAIFQASGGQKAFDQFATAVAGGKLGVTDLSGSATKLASELITTLGNTQQAHKEFDAFATQLHLTKQQADALWQSVVKLAQAEAKIPAHVSSVIQITEQIEQAGGTSGGITGINNGALPALKRARGGPVRGGSGRPGADDIPILGSQDEFVIQAPAVHKYGVDVFESLNAMKYAGGGLVGNGQGSMQGGHSAGHGGVTVVQNYYGTQYPTPEQQQATVMGLTRAIGVAG
jgi:hypothetical protein